MRYIFKVLILGLDIDTVSFYCTSAFQEGGDDKNSYLEWYKEVIAIEDICDLEIDAIVDVIHADYDEILPTVDGIIYFLNPLKKEEIEFFEMIMPIIDSVKRNIPTLLLYDDLQGFLPLSVNELLEKLWINYPHLEAFVNLSPNNFHQALQCLCLAMISGDTPLNIENAWMRFPIYIQLANIYFKQKQYYYAAQAIRKAAIIADVFNNQEYYIISEQAALLFSKVNLYLEASKILKNIDKKKSENFKKLHADAMVTEGHRLFNRKKYNEAAQQYLAAAQFSAIELKDKHIRNEAFRLSVNSWVSACKVESAFNVLKSLPHEGMLLILKEIAGKIIAASDYLVDIKDYFRAKDQLYRAISFYQREGLFEILEKFTPKLEKVLEKILDIQIDNKEKYAAKQTFDEIENLWDAYGVKRTDLDKSLEMLVKLFLESYNFGMASILTNKLGSLSLKKKLTKLSLKAEEDNKELKKKKIEENIQKGVRLLDEFIHAEQIIIEEINTKIIKEANILIEHNDYLKAAARINTQADFLKRIGKEGDHTQILEKALDILLVGKIFEEFFPIYYQLPLLSKKAYLEHKFPVFIKKLDEVRKDQDFNRNEKDFTNAITIYRDQMLYEHSKKVGELYIEVIKDEALRIVAVESNLKGIDKALDLIKKANNISSAYLERKELHFNNIYKKIVEIYITLGDLSSAYAVNDKIDDKWMKSELHKEIAKLESDKISIESKKAEESFKEGLLKEKLSIIKKKARDALNDRDNELKQRRGLKRAYYQTALENLVIEQYDKAIENYKESFDRLIENKRYNLAGVSLAIISLLLMKENKSSEINKLLDSVKMQLSALGRLFSETFSVTLIEYIIEIKKFQDEVKFKESVSFLENLPLFEEEIKILHEFLGKEYKKEVIEESEIVIEDIKKNIEDLVDKIQKEKQDIAKRKLMKNQYWRFPLEDLSMDKLLIASTGYIDTLSGLIDKKFFKQAAISLIISTFLTLKLKNVTLAKTLLFDKLSKFENYKSEFENLPEIQLLKELLFVIENDIKELTEFGIKHLIEKLVLFEPEILFLESLVSKEEKIIIEKESLSRKERGELKQRFIRLEQDFAILQMKLREIRRESEDNLRKRQAMMRIYYREILDLLKNKSFKEAGIKYLDLANNMIKRKDLHTSSLLILLHGLSLLKANESLEKIKMNIDQYLVSLGLNRRLIEDMFYIRCILFILEIIGYKMDNYLSQIRDMLESLPLFEQEKELIGISI